MQQPGSTDPNVGNVLQQLQRALQQQPLPRLGSLVTIGGPTVVAGASGGNAIATKNGSSSLAPKNPAPSPPTYSYKVKIINPAKKSDVSVRYLNNYSAKFESVNALRVKLIKAFQEGVPKTIDFSVGYYEGSQQAKVWLVVADDLKRMYQQYPRGGSVTLWCDARCQEDDVELSSRKRKKDSDTSRKQNIDENERDVEQAFKKLQDKHSLKWDIPRLRLWARCICSQQHSSYDDPPDLPAFKESEPKKRKESLSDALAGAAVAFASAVTGTNKPPDHDSTKGAAADRVSLESASGACVSPGKAVELRMKNFEQLRYLQQLFEDGILSDTEYTEQKRSILSFLRKL